VKVHYVDIEQQLKRVAKRAAENGLEIDHIELTLFEASQLYAALPACDQSKTDFLLGGRCVYQAYEMALELSWCSGLRKDGTLS
jgi:hypothetical protein